MSIDKLGANNGVVVTDTSDGNTIKLQGDTTITGNTFANGNITIGKDGGGALGLYQFGGNNFEPGLKLWNYDADNASNAGNYWDVNNWEDGTTEPGSSGSPSCETFVSYELPPSATGYWFASG